MKQPGLHTESAEMKKQDGATQVGDGGVVASIVAKDAEKAKETPEISEAAEDGGDDGAGKSGAGVEGSSAAAKGAAAAAETPAVQPALPSSMGRKLARPKSLAEIVTEALAQQIFYDGDTQLPVQKPDTLISSLELVHFAESVCDLKSVDELDTHKSLYKTRIATAGQLRDAIGKSALKVTSHLENRKREVERTESKAAKQKEKEAVASAKMKAKIAAKNIEAAERQVPNLFKIDTKTLSTQAMTVLKDVPVEADGSRKDSKKPVLLELPDISGEWLKSSKVQMALSSFGGQYKAQKTCSEHGRSQIPMRPKEGKEETEAMIKKMCGALGWQTKTLVPDEGKAMLQHSWLYGLMPDRSFASTTPQGLGAVKVVAMGKCQVFVFNLGQLTEYMRNRGVVLTDTDLTSTVLSFKEADLEDMVAQKCVFYHATLQPGSGVYIPCGHVLAERVEESVLMYGIRKSICLAGDSGPYSKVCEFQKKSEAPLLARFEAMLTSIQEAEGLGC